MEGPGIKNQVLVKLELLTPHLWSDTGFELQFARKSVHLEGNLADLKVFSVTVLLPFGPWIAAFLEGRLSLEPSSYSTLAPFGTFVEVALTPADHAVFSAIRLSLKLGHADSLRLLEDANQGPSSFRRCQVHHLSPHQWRRRRGKGETLIHELLA